MPNRKRDIEREHVEWVFRLTGGELERQPWAGHKYWYDGVPEYVGEDLVGDPPDTRYRTVVMQAIDALPPDIIESDDGSYDLAEIYSSSGEADCPNKYDADNGKLVVRTQCDEHNNCETCHAALDDDHGQLSIGDGWVEAVYRKTPPPEDN